jgi:hypothetical protein
MCLQVHIGAAGTVLLRDRNWGLTRFRDHPGEVSLLGRLTALSLSVRLTFGEFDS